LAELQNIADVQIDTIIVVSHTNASKNVTIFSAFEMGLEHGTKYLIVPEENGLDDSLIAETAIGNRGTVLTKTTDIRSHSAPTSVKIVYKLTLRGG